MIIVYTGLPRSGKSLYAVSDLIEQLSKGKTVYSNIDGFSYEVACRLFPKCKKGKYEHRDNEWFSNLENLKKVVEKVSFFIDEAHEIWSSLVRKSFGQDELVYFSRHGKFGHNLFVISQSLESLPSQLRQRIAHRFHFTKMNFMGSLFNNRYSMNKYLSDGKIIQSSPIFGYKYRTELFPLYKSFDVQNDEHQKQSSPLIKPLIALVVVVIFVFYSLKGVVFGSSESDRIEIVSDSKINNPTPKNPISLKSKNDLKISFAYSLDGNDFVNYCLLDCSIVSLEYVKFKHELTEIKTGQISVLYNSNKSIVLEVSRYVPKIVNIGSSKSKRGGMFTKN